MPQTAGPAVPVLPCRNLPGARTEHHAVGPADKSLLDTGNSILIWLCLVIATGLLAPAIFAPQRSLLSRQFPPDVRVSGVGTGREIGAALSGGLAPLAALAIAGASATNATPDPGDPRSRPGPRLPFLP